MRHYSVDNEIVTDLYRDYRQEKSKDVKKLRQIGKQYLPLLESYELNKNTAFIISRLSRFRTQEQLDEIETRLIRAYLAAKKDLQEEQHAYKEFVNQFEGEKKQALTGLWEYVVGQKKIPYKIKNHSLHIDVLNTMAMSLELDFYDVLIEDGRRPREILLSHIAGETFEKEEVIKHEDGTEETVMSKMYRLRFINGLSEGPYQAKESSFVFKSLEGSLHLYDYASCQEPVDVNADKLPWRLLMHPLKAMLEKAQVLGIGAINSDEMAALPLLCVFYELIEFYLDNQTKAGIGRSLIQFDQGIADNFAFSQMDLDSACDYLAPYGLTELCTHLQKAIEHRQAFCHYWIQFASTKKAEQLYYILYHTLYECGKFYKRHPMPLAYIKQHGTVRRMLSDYFSRRKWKGEFPFFRHEQASNFLEVSNVYKKMYTYINEKRKAYYVDFIEAVSGQSYSVMAVFGYILLRDHEDLKDYRALNGYFVDGGRRSSHIVGQVTIDDTMNSEQVVKSLESMLEDITKKMRL